jgi:polysaccharide biosynthesis transport protein
MPLTPQDNAALPSPRQPEDFGGGYPGGFEEDGDEGVDVRRLLSAVWRYKWLVLVLGAIGFGGGYALTKMVKPTYEAQATIQVPSGGAGGGLAGAPEALRSAPLFDASGWVQLVRSFEVLDHVVRGYRLYLELDVLADSQYLRGFELDEQFTPGEYRVSSPVPGVVRLSLRDGAMLAEASVGDSIGRPQGFRWIAPGLPVGKEVGFRVRVPRDASVRLGSDLSTSLPQDGALMRLSLRGTDPVFTAATVNAVAARFVEVATLLKREKLTSVVEELRKQLERSRAELANAESSLERFKVTTITLPSDRGASPIAAGLAETRDPVRQAFFQLRIQREDLVRDRDAVRRALAAAGDTTRSLIVGLGTIAAVRESQELARSLDLLTTKRAEARQMALAFSSSHPPLRELRREVEELELRTIPEQAEQLIGNMDLRIRDLDDRIASSAREMQQIPVRVTEELRRERDVEVAQMIYTELQSAYEQARLAELNATPDVRLLDSAVPPTRPVQDQVLILFAGMGLAGVGLGLGLAIVLDRVDKKLRYPSQVTRELGLPILGAIPLLKLGRNKLPDQDSADAVTEAMRTIRMSALYAHGSAGPFVTTVSSPGPGDGKSFVSMQLAASFALSGRRTLLIDGDNRRGLLHRTLGVARKPGLMDVLTENVALDDVLHRGQNVGFDLIPSGTHRRAAPELLASAAMQRLMMELRGRYDAIILDSPPLGAGVDPLVLASLSGTLMLIMRNGVTDRELAAARLGDLERLPIRLLGAVLNDVTSKGAYRYYSYLSGYRTEEEQDELPSAPTPRRVIGA